MRTILIASISPFSGKNVIGLGLARKLAAEGRKVGCFKPIGPIPVFEENGFADADALFFKKALHLAEPVEALCPVVLGDETVASVLRGHVQGLKAKILLAFKAVSQHKDVVLAFSMGGLSCGRSIGFSMSDLARELDARVLVVDPYRWPLETLDGLFEMQAALGDRLAGVVFNNVSSAACSSIEPALRPLLKGRGIEVFGAIPEDAVLNATPVRRLVEALHGKVLCCSNRLDDLVERTSIGAMNVEAALRFFRRVPHKAVITGGDRPDIHLAALETSTRCLILTGGLYPNERILARAEEAGVPVVLVEQETSAVAETCERLHGRSGLDHPQKIARIDALMETGLDWGLVRQKLGLA